MYYIEKTDKPSFLEQKLYKIKIIDDKIFLPIRQENLIKQENPIKQEMPNNKEKNNNEMMQEKNKTNNISEKIQTKLAEKTNKFLQKSNSNKLVLSREIQKLNIFVNKLHTYNYNIVNGEKLFEALVCITLEYICQKSNIQKEETKISVLVNDLSDYTLQNIKQIATKYKTLNIVSNHLEKFKKIENGIYDESGLMITVSNNKKKSLIKSDIIVNIDFPEELLNKYNIKDDAIILNIFNNIRIDKKRFNGLIINDYEISAKDNYLNDIDSKKYYTKELYEAQIYNGIPYMELMKKIKNDRVQIKELYGLNGKVF